MINFGVKCTKRSVKMWTANFYKSFFQKCFVVHEQSAVENLFITCTYVMPRTVYFSWICILLTKLSLYLQPVKSENRKYHFCNEYIIYFAIDGSRISLPLVFNFIYNASQKHDSTLLHAYVLNEFLTADRSSTTKYFWKNSYRSW